MLRLNVRTSRYKFYYNQIIISFLVEVFKNRIMKKVTTLILVLTFSIGFAQDTKSFFDKADVFFKTYVQNGKVDYKSIQENPESLKELMILVGTTSINKSDPKTHQAFYINAYNLSVIQGILYRYPVKSPLDIQGFFDKKSYIIAGEDITLNTLENTKLRANYPEEGRFHFVLVCAGLGCPPIIAEAYTPSALEAQLERQTKLALNNPSFIKVKGSKVQISMIFKWYKEDFTHNGSEIEYINKFRKTPIPTSAKVSYYTYDWTLNQL